MKLRELQPLVDMMVASGWGDSEVVARLGDEYYTVSDFSPSNADGTADHCEIVLGRIGRCICARCAKYDGCPNAVPPDEDVPGYEGICANCRTNRRHLGYPPEPATKSILKHPLVYTGGGADVPVITIENYCKWYALQVVMPNGDVVEYHFGHLEPYAQHYVADHCPNPVAVVRWARAKGFHVHEESLEMILGRWLLESGESNPAALLVALNEALAEEV